MRTEHLASLSSLCMACEVILPSCVFFLPVLLCYLYIFLLRLEDLVSGFDKIDVREFGLNINCYFVKISNCFHVPFTCHVHRYTRNTSWRGGIFEPAYLVASILPFLDLRTCDAFVDCW